MKHNKFKNLIIESNNEGLAVEYNYYWKILLIKERNIEIAKVKHNPKSLSKFIINKNTITITGTVEVYIYDHYNLELFDSVNVIGNFPPGHTKDTITEVVVYDKATFRHRDISTTIPAMLSIYAYDKSNIILSSEARTPANSKMSVYCYDSSILTLEGGFKASLHDNSVGLISNKEAVVTLYDNSKVDIYSYPPKQIDAYDNSLVRTRIGEVEVNLHDNAKQIEANTGDEYYTDISKG